MHPSATMNVGAPSVLKKYWHLWVLAFIALLSFGLNFVAIAKIGYGNAYYAAAIRSMTESFRNFFFVSFDPAGVVSVDKPPLGLWVQTLFVLIFGYHGWAMLLPQALSATGAALMMYLLTSKYFGRISGLIAALVFAVTPAVVVAARNNTMDTQLVLVLLTAAWFLLKSIETSKRRYLLICAVFVGLGFNIKMLEAYMILPAIVLVYLIFDRNRIIKSVAAGLVSLALMLTISSAWVLAVDFTPAAQRPYVGSSSNNSEVQLMFGHNGLERLYGSGGGTGGFFGKTPVKHTGGQSPKPGKPAQSAHPQKTVPPPAQPYDFGAASPGGTRSTGGSNGGGTIAAGGTAAAGMNAPWQALMSWSKLNGQAGGGGNDIGVAGILRLWNDGLFGQITWLFILALFCILVRAGRFSFRRLTVKQALFVFWILWLASAFLFFSFASFWHRYYLCIVAPAIAGLVGIGLPELIRAFRDRQGWKQFLLPAALLCTAAPELSFVWGYDALRVWLAPLIIAAAAAALALMAVHFFRPRKLVLYVSSALTLLALLAGPVYWSLTAVLYVEQNSTLPYAGPELQTTTVSRFTTPNQEVLTTGDAGTVALEKYLTAHYTPGSYLVVSRRADDVAQFIVDTGLPAVAYGGFLGSDNALTPDALKALVAEGKVTYFLISGQNGPNDAIDNYVRSHAVLVSPSDYLGNVSLKSGSSGTINGIGGASLYLFTAASK